jgi:hypothetical protein
LLETFELAAEFEFPSDPEQAAKPIAPAVTMKLMHAAREIETAAPFRLRSIRTSLFSADIRNLNLRCFGSTAVGSPVGLTLT